MLGTCEQAGCFQHAELTQPLPRATFFLLSPLRICTWYTYLLSLAAGFFLANDVPHIVYDISGDAFPAPFAKQSSVGLATSPVNVAEGQAAGFLAGAEAIGFALSKSLQEKLVLG